MEIKFNPTSEEAEISVAPPKPAVECLPEYYKSMRFVEKNSNDIEFDSAGNPMLTVKACMPFRDAMVSGYIQETWQDIYIALNEDGTAHYGFPSSPPIINSREKPSISIPEEFYNFELVFYPPWWPELPKGWSAIFTTPFNRLDLPFKVLDGIVDADSMTESNALGNLPFFLRKNVVGLIPKGTPMYQIIPFKRENWQSSPQPYNKKKHMKGVLAIQQHIWGGYKKLHWSKKSYK
jgi:hypothetical protein